MSCPARPDTGELYCTRLLGSLVEASHSNFTVFDVLISEILNSIEANQKYDNISRMDDSIKNSCESCCLIQNIVSVAQSVDERTDS